MSKLILFLFLGVCVVAVHMAPATNEDEDSEEAALEAIVDSFESQLKEEFLEEDPRVNWKKVWKKARPILIEAGKVVGGAAIAGAIGG